MKNLFLLFVLLISTAEAVTVSKCPDTLSVKVSGISVDKSLDDIFSDESFLNWNSDEVSEEYSNAIEKAYNKAVATTEVERKFSLKQKRHGRCSYQHENTRSNEKIEIYTKGRKDVFYLQIDLESDGILLRNYGKVDLLSLTAVELSPTGTALAIPRSNYTNFSAGGPLVFIGKAESAKATLE